MNYESEKCDHTQVSQGTLPQGGSLRIRFQGWMEMFPVALGKESWGTLVARTNFISEHGAAEGKCGSDSACPPGR